MSTKLIVKAILLMGGEGTRFGGKVPKQFLNLSGKPVYHYALDTLLSFPLFKEILIVLDSQWIPKVSSKINDPRIRLIPGGHTRQDSSYRGLISCGKETDAVVIHDAVRPFASRKIIAAHLNLLSNYQAINTCIRSNDTLVHVKNSNTIDTIPNRAQYQRGQTPQSFSYPLILHAHETAPHQNASDDCSLITALNKEVHIVPGSENNIKITTSLDLFLAEQLIRTHSTSLTNARARSLTGKIFAITGGTGGIGSALAKKLTTAGAKPLIISKSSPTHPVDLTKCDQTATLFETLHNTYGPIDGLINCVGSLILQPFHSLKPTQIEQLIATNLHSLLYSCRYAHLKPGSHIVNLSSSAFTRGRKSYVLYSSAKAAIVNFTQGLAEERPDLRINAVVPQRTNTPLRQQNFPNEDPEILLSADEVADEIIHLLQQEEITGTLLEVRKQPN